MQVDLPKLSTPRSLFLEGSQVRQEVGAIEQVWHSLLQALQILVWFSR